MSDGTIIPAAPGIRALFIDPESGSTWVGDVIIAWHITGDPRDPVEAIGADGPVFWNEQSPAYVFPDRHVESEGEVYGSARLLRKRRRRSEQNIERLRRQRAKQAKL